MKLHFTGGKELSNEYGGAWGNEIANDSDRPLALLDSQWLADPKKVSLARSWFVEVHRDQLEPLGTKGRRFTFEGSEYFLDES